MAINLTREADLAVQLDWTEARVADRRRRDRWPHVRLGRFDVRYTDQQIEAIVAMYEVTPAKAKPSPTPSAPVLGGQTKRSAARSRS